MWPSNTQWQYWPLIWYNQMYLCGSFMTNKFTLSFGEKFLTGEQDVAPRLLLGLTAGLNAMRPPTLYWSASCVSCLLAGRYGYGNRECWEPASLWWHRQTAAAAVWKPHLEQGPWGYWETADLRTSTDTRTHTHIHISTPGWLLWDAVLKWRTKMWWKCTFQLIHIVSSICF